MSECVTHHDACDCRMEIVRELIAALEVCSDDRSKEPTPYEDVQRAKEALRRAREAGLE